MHDYKAIAALQAVIETQSFEMAANKLFITQSAISQRIKSLEQQFGEPLLIRTQPYHPTRLGELLLGHFKRVMLLEQSFDLGINTASTSAHISIAISRDSLETWFVNIYKDSKTMSTIHLEVIADDQEIVHEYLRKGLVSACAGTYSKVIKGCKKEFLGYFDYALVASPEFINKHFSKKGNIKEQLLTAPTITFDDKDSLHAHYLQHYFNIHEPLSHFHRVPSVKSFREFVLQGYAYALIPAMDIAHELKTGQLINLFPDKIWAMPLYWHSFELETKIYEKFNSAIMKLAGKLLRQKSSNKK